MNKYDTFDICDMYLNRREAKRFYVGYDPKAFWEDFGKYYLDVFFPTQEHFNLNTMQFLLRVSILKSKTILEVGAGFGRLLAALMIHNDHLKLDRVEGIELSKTMIEHAEDFYKRCPQMDGVGRPKIIQGNADNLPYEDKEFDLVYSHVCLTHIPPKQVVKVREEISRVAKNNIIHIERFAFPYEKPSPHRWSHQHIPHYLDMGWEVMENICLIKEHDTNLLVLKRA